MLALAADGEATSEQLWAIQEQVAGIAALCSGDFETKTALSFDGADPGHTLDFRVFAVLITAHAKGGANTHGS